jgi:sarcosine oxidase
MTYDAVVLGLGGMGSAALAHLAARGLRVLGVEQFEPLHARGASTGRTRIIRQAYFEHPSYVPLLRRAYELWDELERRTGATLRARTGGLFVGRPESEVVAGTVASALEHGLPHEVLDAGELRARYPQLRPRDDEIAVFEAVAGALFPERCVHAHLRAAIEDGAEARFGTRAVRWEARGPDEVAVIFDGESVEARRLVVCAGAWFASLAGDLTLPLRVERNVQFWFAPLLEDAVAPSALPIFALQRDGQPFMFYGFPDFGDGVKCAFHHSRIFADVEALDRVVREEEVEAACSALRAWLPDAAGAFREAAVCTYTMTPDEHFVVGRHPAVPEAILAGGFSGHGFKFCSVVGEIVANLVTNGEPGYPIPLFAPARFAT